jgi:hypothetical protein
MIECAAKQRIADEYDAAQEPGVAGPNERRPRRSDVERLPGLSRKETHEARQIRDAER